MSCDSFQQSFLQNCRTFRFVPFTSFFPPVTASWNAADASDLMMKATFNKVKSELEELKFSMI